MTDALPPVGLGTMGIDDPDVVTTALDLGYRHVDTAQIYDNEAVVGAGVAAADVPRADVFLATKVWADSLAPDDVAATTMESLDRLGVGMVDLLYVHRPIETYEPAATLGAFDDLVDQGRVGHVGVSNFEPAELDAAREHLDAPLFAHQTELHPLYHREDLVADAQRHDHWLVAYSPLGGGKALELPEVRAVAEKHDATPAAVCLAWCTAKENVVVIPKASSPEHLRANLEAATLELDAEDVARIDGVEREEELFPE